MGAMRFMHMGRPAHFVGEATAPSIRTGDGLCLVSGSGNTAVTVHFARIATDEGAEIALITREPDRPRGKRSSPAPPVPTEATPQFGGSLFEQTSLVLLDAIVLELRR